MQHRYTNAHVYKRYIHEGLNTHTGMNIHKEEHNFAMINEKTY